MTDHERVPRYVPPTPRSRRLGRELRALRDAKGMRAEDAANALNCSQSRLSRIESGEIRIRVGDLMGMLTLYGVPLSDERAKQMLDVARQIREPGWWQSLGKLTQKYLTYISFEDEATELSNYEPTLVPGLLQTEAYARAVISVGQETEAAIIEQRLSARLTRQHILTRDDRPLRLHAILSETALVCEVGGPDVLREQLRHIVEMSGLPNITVQVLRFAAGAHLASHGGFAVLGFDKGNPDLGYIETLSGELFIEAPEQIRRLTTVFDHLRQQSLSPAESVKLIKERGK